MSISVPAVIAAMAMQAVTGPPSITLNCQISGESHWEARSGTAPLYEADNAFAGRGSIRIDFANRNVTFNFTIAGDKSDRSGNGLRVEPGAHFVREFMVFDRSQIVICEGARGCDGTVRYMDGANEVEATFSPTVIDLERRTFSVNYWTRVRNSRSRLYETMRYNGTCT